LTADELAIKEFDCNPKEKDAWFQRTRSAKCLELDALGLPRIRKLFADEIESRIDLTPREDDIREGFVEEIVSKHMSPAYRNEKYRLMTRVKSSPAWAEVEETPIPDDSFMSVAIAGGNYVSPSRIFGKDIAAAIKAVLAEAS
jgi:hypothetical protein